MFGQSFEGSAHSTPRVITVDKNAAYSMAIEAMKADETLAAAAQLRQSKSLNNVTAQDHRNIKRVVKPMMDSSCLTVRDEPWVGLRR